MAIDKLCLILGAHRARGREVAAGGAPRNGRKCAESGLHHKQLEHHAHGPWRHHDAAISASKAWHCGSVHWRLTTWAKPSCWACLLRLGWHTESAIWLERCKCSHCGALVTNLMLLCATHFGVICCGRYTQQLSRLPNCGLASASSVIESYSERFTGIALL